ncbi:MAG: hypothetical protein IKE53_02990 [Clostridiales bacterium]|nr:hypothetical protein [Clostridiales bacterium]
MLSHFGTIKNIEKATEEELSAVKGISSADARSIRIYFDTEG